MGKYLKTGEARLILLQSPDFKHKFVTGIEGIGDTRAYEEVKKVVVPKLNDISNFDGTEKDYFAIASNVADAMRVLAIGSSHFKTVGGLIHCWILDRNGIYEQRFSYTEDPTGKTDQWHRVTAERDELTTLKDRLNLGPDYLIK